MYYLSQWQVLTAGPEGVLWKFIFLFSKDTLGKSSYLIKPLPSLSKTLNASLISSSESVSFILLAIMVRNSGKSMVPLPFHKTNKFHLYHMGFSMKPICHKKFQSYSFKVWSIQFVSSQSKWIIPSWQKDQC